MHRHISAVALAVFLLLSFSQTHANTETALDFRGKTDDTGLDFDQFDVFDSIDVFVRILAGQQPSTGGTVVEYDFSDSDTEVTFNGEPLDTPTPIQQIGAPIALAVESSNAPFDTVIISFADDTTLSDGTFIGDAIGIGFTGGTGTFEGILVRSLGINLRDSTGTVLDGVDFEQLFELELTDFTSTGFNISTPEGVVTGTLTGYEATVIPIPAAVWLFGSALGLVAWTKRRSG